MTLAVRPLKPSPNWTILNAIRDKASLDYQSRINPATKANIQSVVKDLWDYAPARNEFLDAFINRIGLVVARNISWTNPLAKFKIGALEFGDTIEEYIVGLLEAQAYDPNRDALERDVFGQAVIDVQSSFHKVNRQDMYKITINEPILKRAFLSDNGLSSLIAQLMQAPATSDEWDEYLLTTSLFREYYDNGGFFKVNVPDIAAAGSTAADAKVFLRKMRSYAQTLTFISSFYNPAGMPVAAKPEELELFITPDGLAAIDVEALAAAFNADKADMPMRYTVIPPEHMRIPGAQAILTTRDFFVIADQRIETRSINNPAGLYDNYFFHHWQVISASRFVPAILFTSTEPSTVIDVTPAPVTAVSALTVYDKTGTVDATGKLVRGDFYTLDAYAVTTGTNDAVRYDLAGALSPRSFVSQTGTIYMAPDEDSTSVTVARIATDNNTITATTTFTVVGDKVDVWPTPDVDLDADKDALFEAVTEAVGPAPTSGANKNKVTIPNTEGVLYKDGATTVNGQTITLTANKTITATAAPGWEISGTVSWNLVYTA